MKKQVFVWLSIVWIIFIISSFVWNTYMVSDFTTKLAQSKAEAFFNQILITRRWNAVHGGVYVPITKTNPPNEYLKDLHRDIITTDSLRFTKVNPAYMTRQIAELNNVQNDIVFHITSLNPIRPANKADNWESKVLKEFESGSLYHLSIDTLMGKKNFRYMAPLYVEKSCQTCHNPQYNSLGSVRGGISVSFDTKPFFKSRNSILSSLFVLHLFVGLIGFFGLQFFAKYVKRNYKLLQENKLDLESKNVQLIQLKAQKDRIYQIIAHDLRNPFNSIIGLSDYLMEKSSELGDRPRRALEMIEETTLQSFQLLENLLKWASNERGELDIKKEEFNILRQTERAISSIKPTAIKKSISIEIEINNDCTIVMDKSMFEVIIRNLITNAIKFSFPGKSVKIICDRNENDVLISVADEGVGMDNNTIENLYNSHMLNISRKGTQKEHGTGLGLKLCFDFAEMNGGKILIQSEPGKGSIFTLLIPS